MKKYFFILHITWSEYIAYRLNFALEVVGGVFQTLITAMVWLALFSYQDTALIAGFRLPEMMTYVFGGGVISSFLLLTSQGDDINDDVHLGTLSHLLVKPLNPNFYWFVRDVCRKFMTFLIGITAFILLFLFFHSLILLPISFIYFLFAGLFVVFAALIHFLLFYIFSIMAFWFDQTWGMRTLLRVVMELASGILIPLSFFPSGIQSVLLFLPMKFFAFVPMQIYLGNFHFREILFSGGEAVLWIATLLGISFLLWKRGLRSYNAAGI